jgi:hypothetical protein
VEDRNNEAKPQGEVERLWDIIGKCANWEHYFKTKVLSCKSLVGCGGTSL